MVDRDNEMLNFPIETNLKFSQNVDTETVVSDRAVNALCVTWNGVDDRTIGGME